MGRSANITWVVNAENPLCIRVCCANSALFAFPLKSITHVFVAIIIFDSLYGNREDGKNTLPVDVTANFRRAELDLAVGLNAVCDVIEFPCTFYLFIAVVNLIILLM